MKPIQTLVSVAGASSSLGAMPGPTVDMATSDVRRRHWLPKPMLLKTYKGKEIALSSHPGNEEYGFPIKDM